MAKGHEGVEYGEGCPILTGWGLERAVPLRKILKFRSLLKLRILVYSEYNPSHANIFITACNQRGNSPNSQYTTYVYTQKDPLP